MITELNCMIRCNICNVAYDYEINKECPNCYNNTIKEVKMEQELKTDKNKPHFELNIGNQIKLVFWEQEILKDNQKFKILNPVINKSWKNDKGEWKQQNITIPFNVLYRLMNFGAQILSIEAHWKEKQKNSEEE